MCCFSQPVAYVGGTRIFARSAGGDLQHLVYAMRVASREPVAMVLPLPVPVGVADDALRFVDLSGYPDLFDDLAKGFPGVFETAPSRGGPGPQPARRTLVVHDVGDFEASFVPSVADFDRLDARFRLPTSVWEAVPEVADFGFAVFQLRGFGGGLVSWLRRPKPKTFHPMAFTFPRRDPDALFFPTLHVHDGAVHPTARFDHTLYLQAEAADAQPGGAWEPAASPARDHVRIDATAGLVDGALPCHRLILRGDADNRDIRVARLRGG